MLAISTSRFINLIWGF